MAVLGDTLPQLRADIAGALSGRLDELVDEHMRRIHEEAPAIFDMPAPIAEAARTICRGSMTVEIEYLAAGVLPETCPQVDLDYARAGAELSFPPAEVVRACHRAHEVLWEAWAREVEAAGLDDPTRRSLLEDGSRLLFAYADRIARWTIDAYLQARDRALESFSQRQVNVVRDVLADRAVSPAALGYDLDAWHTAVVLWGPDPEAAAQELARETGRRLLIVNPGDETLWAWLGGEVRLARGQRPRATSAARVALGRDASGADGFRTSHQQATRAYAVARMGDSAVTTFDDVALEVLMASDPPAATAFIREELGTLTGADERSRTLRATLRAWFATGHNAAAAAARLGVHEQTVAARLRVVEEQTGRPPRERRAELEAALRLHAYLAIYESHP